MKRLLWSAPVICLFIACTVNLAEPEGRACDADHGCAPGLSCQGGTCVLDDPNSIEPQPDGGANSSSDAGLDAGQNGPDAGSDAGVNPTGGDAGTDGGFDAGMPPGTDAGVDAGTDAGSNPSPDAGTDTDAGSWDPGADGGYPPNTFFVDPAGDDSFDGRSPTTPWKTVAKVNAAALPAGAWVLFKGGGVWNESLTNTRSGVAGSPIYFGAYGTGRPVFDGTGVTTGNSALNVNSKSWLYFRGLELRNWHSGYQLVYLSNTHNVVFEDLYLHDADKGFHASPSAASTDITIRNTVVENISGGTYTHGLSVPTGGTGWVISDSRFSNIEQSCVIDSGNGTVWLRNTFYDCGKITTTSDKNGIYLRGPNTVIRENQIHDVAGSCVMANYEGAVIEANQIWACGASGIEWMETSTLVGTLTARRNRIWDSVNGINIGTATAEKFHLSNNSILSTRATGAAGAAGVLVKANTEVSLENNLVTGGATSALSVNRTGSSGTYTDRTNIWNSTASAGTPINWNGASMTMAQYRTASGQMTSSEVDPQITSTVPTAPDFQLVSSSPARDFGVTSPATGALTPACDGAVDHYCGVAPEAGAMEILTP